MNGEDTSYRVFLFFFLKRREEIGGKFPLFLFLFSSSPY